ncbi:type III pantothenate kinase [Marinoscillum furvescens]|uniref:Type III pantothenate kinase n=1 Tax=Marinoscillum furvescens DSM 4134 TaxID=1122208 RepID=A0A3D9L396_MARFU|nr:type III pantothenate kinase [Marinoscillum furvescens]RED98862.1 type III pantothenate kinase [Marinoscillum furvescens DSM 4134]
MNKSRNVAVDVGNSSAKVGVFENDALIRKEQVQFLKDLPKDLFGKGHHWMFSSVAGAKDLSSLMEGESYQVLDAATPLPIKVSYQTPNTLGVDRLAAAVGGCAHYPDRNLLVVDAGSCITYDLVTREGTFEGGVIAPGLLMRMRAMSEFTHALPDIRSEWAQHFGAGAGKTTRACLARGAVDGIRHEIDGFIEQFSKDYNDLIVIMTGGDTVHFESILKAPIFADFDLVLKGLNRILNHNQ